MSIVSDDGRPVRRRHLAEKEGSKRMSIRETLAAALAATLIAAGCGSDEAVLDDNVSPLREVSASACNSMRRLTDGRSMCDFFFVTKPATVEAGTKVQIINWPRGSIEPGEYEVRDIYVRSSQPDGTRGGPTRDVEVSLVDGPTLDAMVLPEHYNTVERDDDGPISAKLVFYIKTGP